FCERAARTPRCAAVAPRTFCSVGWSCAPRVTGATSGQRRTVATPAIPTTRVSRGTATAGKAAARTFCGQICSNRRSWSLYSQRTQIQRSSAPPSSVWRIRAAEQGPDSASQVRRLEAEISGNESAVQRYYNAFENGRLPETRVAGRVDALERRLTELRAKLEEVRDSAKSVEAPRKQAVRDAEEAVRDAMLNGTPGQRKALLKELIVEVRVESRDSIIPTFRLPATSVRVTESVVGRSFRNANQPSILGKVIGLGQPGDALLKPGKP